LSGSVCRFTHAVGFVVGQARVVAFWRGAQVPFVEPVVALEQPMQSPAPATASAHVELQQTLSTQAPLTHSPAPPHAVPTPFFATQTFWLQ